MALLIPSSDQVFTEMNLVTFPQGNMYFVLKMQCPGRIYLLIS